MLLAHFHAQEKLQFQHNEGNKNLPAVRSAQAAGRRGWTDTQGRVFREMPASITRSAFAICLLAVCLGWQHQAHFNKQLLPDSQARGCLLP